MGVRATPTIHTSEQISKHRPPKSEGKEEKKRDKKKWKIEAAQLEREGRKEGGLLYLEVE